MPDSRTACVVTVNYGSSRLLERNFAQLPDETSVIVVDNFSDMTERSEILKLGTAREWMVLTPESNLGFGDGVNLGVEQSLADGADVVLVVNPDAVLTSENVEDLVSAALSRPRSLIAPLTADRDGRINYSGQEVDVAEGRTRKADFREARNPWLTGACLVFTPEAWRISGGFAGEYFLYWEDVDISWAMLARGGSLHLEETVTVIHDEGGTQAKSRVSSKSPTYVYFNCRNRLVFAARNLTREQARSWARGSTRYAREVLLSGGSRLALVSPRHVWAAFRGTAAGLRELWRSERGA